MKNKFLLLVLVSLLIPLLSSCTKPHSIILEDSTCSPPCWKSIHPGTTQVKDAVQILKSMQEVHFPPSFYERDTDKGEGFFSWFFDGSVPESSGRIYFHNHLVTKIRFNTKHLTFGDVVSKLGDPAQFLAVSGWADTQWLEIFLIYPSSGIVVTYYKSYFWGSDNGQFDLVDDLRVFSILYFNPELYSEVLITDVFNRTLADHTTLTDNLQDWDGFGTIEYLNEE